MSDKNTKRFAKKQLETIIHSPPDENDIDTCLTNIYQDHEGRIPNMKEISIKKSSPFVRILSFVFGLVVVCALLAWAGFLYFPGQTANENGLVFDIRGSRDVAVGVTTTYTLSYANTSDAHIKNATLSVHYPEGFVFITSSVPSNNSGHTEWKINSLKSSSEGSLIITGKYYGQYNEQKTWRTFFNYTPDNFNSELQKITTLTAVINDNPYKLELTGSDGVAVGSDAFYTFSVSKTTNNKQPIQLSIVPPGNFIITSSTPALKNNKVTIDWGSTTSPDNFRLIIKGKFKNADTPNMIKGVLYLPFADTNQLFTIATAGITSQLLKSDLEFGTTINGTQNDTEAKPGETLAVTIHLKNSSPEEMKNAAVTISFDAPSVKRQSLLNWSGLEDKYDGSVVGEQLTDTVRRGQITWNSKKISDLAKIKPGSEVLINVKLPLKTTTGFDYSAIKETVIKVNSSVDYLDAKGISKSTAGNPIIITLETDLAFIGRDTLTINGQGKEEHAVSWILTNTFHPLKNITATAVAYGDTTFLSGETTDGTSGYDPRDKKIIWTIDELQPGDNQSKNTFTLVLNTKNPTQNTLLSKVTIEAEDAITGQKISLIGKEITLK